MFSSSYLAVQYKNWEAGSSKQTSGTVEGFSACAIKPEGGTQIFSNGYTLVENTTTVARCVNTCMQKVTKLLNIDINIML